MLKPLRCIHGGFRVRPILITGGAGFIGSNFCHYWAAQYPGDKLIVLDALTYAGHREHLAALNYELTQLVDKQQAVQEIEFRAGEFDLGRVHGRRFARRWPGPCQRPAAMPSANPDASCRRPHRSCSFASRSAASRLPTPRSAAIASSCRARGRDSPCSHL